MVGWQILEGDCLERLRELDAGSAQTCVTSPPYFGLRDYGHKGQIGLEPTPDEFVSALVDVFREVRRVLRDDGTVWLNIGDSYASASKGSGGTKSKQPTNAGSFYSSRFDLASSGLKPKDLVGVPWRVAFALQADGWYLRSEIIWHKPNPMPESITDRPTKAHEQLFLLSKQPRYFYDAAAIREDAETYGRQGSGRDDTGAKNGSIDTRWHKAPQDRYDIPGRNKRSVWTVATRPFSGAHFATFPPRLIEPCVLAGSAVGDVVLDPFAGAGTTGLVATRHGRSFVGIELNPEYAEMARTRIRDDAPLMNYVTEVAA